MEFSGVFSNKSSFTIEEEALDELLDEFWFFENLFHRRPKVFLSTNDLWNNIQNMKLENQDAKNSSSISTPPPTPPPPPPSNISKEEDRVVVRHNLLRTPSLPPPIWREKMAQDDEEVVRKSLNKLARQGSLNSSKVIRQQRVPEVLYNNHQHSSDMLYHYSSNNIQEIQVARDSPSNPINYSKGDSSFIRHNLLRTPSLPPSREEEEFLRISNKFTRQASLSSLDLLPPIQIPNKVGILQPTTRRNHGIPRQRARKETKLEISNSIKDVKTIPPCPSKEVIRRSLSYKKSSSTKTDLEVEEVQGFKDLGFVFDKEEINKSLANIIPGLQEKKPTNGDENKKSRRGPYLSEAWLVQPAAAPAVPDWVDRRSVGDMKAQLKFWARAVASNVRTTEC